LIQIRKLRVLAVLSLLGVATLVLLRIFDPATSGMFPPCPLHYLTGLYCPGCGSLRAIHALLQGDLRQAWAMNALTVVMLPFIAYGMTSQLHLQLRGRALPGPMLPPAWIRALCLAIILFGIARNLPIHPFDLLAPGAMLRLG
jgi:hypothetical protein